MRRALVLLMLVVSPPVLAAKPRVVIDAPPTVGKLVLKALGKKYTPSPPKRPLSDEPTLAEVTAATRDIGAIAVIHVRLVAGKQWYLQVLNAFNGVPLTGLQFKNQKKLAWPKQFTSMIRESLNSASPAPPLEEPAPTTAGSPATTTAPVAVAPSAAPVEPQQAASQPTPAPSPLAETKASLFEDSGVVKPVERPLALRLGLGFAGMARDYTYRDDIFEDLAKYRLPFGPLPSAQLEFFPAAFFTSGVAAHFGVAGSFNYLVGVSSKVGDVRFQTTSMRVHGSLIGRIPLGVLEVQLGVGYALQTFSIATSAPGATRPNIPNVSFSGVRPSLGASVHFTPVFHLHFGGAYQVLLTKGEFGTFFPQSTGGGADVWVGVGVRPISHFEIRLQGEYGRYFFTLNPEVGDPYVAGGALDQYLAGVITANVVF